LCVTQQNFGRIAVGNLCQAVVVAGSDLNGAKIQADPSSQPKVEGIEIVAVEVLIRATQVAISVDVRAEKVTKIGSYMDFRGISQLENGEDRQFKVIEIEFRSLINQAVPLGLRSFCGIQQLRLNGESLRGKELTIHPHMKAHPRVLIV